jgi:hypothetical protein
MTLHLLPRFAACAAAILLTAAGAQAGEKKLMHCFAWTSVKTASPAEWDAFFKVSEQLPQKINGLTKIWYGKLAAPIGQFGVKVDDVSRKKMNAGETVTGEIARITRDWGMCMEMAGEATLKAYGSDPFHKVWTEAYAKIRVEGTTTFNILGQ